MITYAWYDGAAPDVEGLRRMLAEAAAEDAEAGFTPVRLTDADLARGRHLVVHLVPDERTGLPRSGADADSRAGAEAGGTEPAAYLRVDPGGEVWFVVRPVVRSRGVATLLFEQVGLDVEGPDGWVGTGERVLAGWARGDHPAAQRLARRFGVRRTLREWQLLAPLRTRTTGGDTGTPAQSAPAAEQHAPARTAPAARLRPFDPATDAADLAALRESAAPTHSVGMWLYCNPVAGKPHSNAVDGHPEQPGAEHAGARDDGGRPPGTTEVSVLVAAVAGGGLVGAVGVDPAAGVRTEYGPAGRITELLVHPEHAGGPVRGELVRAALDRLHGAGRRVAAIVVDSRDEPLLRDCRLRGFMHDRTDSRYQVGQP